MHYIAANQCIQLANEVFGFNGWSSSIREIQVDYVSLRDEEYCPTSSALIFFQVEEIPNTGRVNMAASVIMRVTLRDGTFHEVDNVKMHDRLDLLM